MAVTIKDLGEGIALVTMAGKSATQSFSMEFLPKIAEAIQSTLANPSVKAVILLGKENSSQQVRISTPLLNLSKMMTLRN